MLELWRMVRQIVRLTVLIGLVWLLFLPNPIAHPSLLREEAVGYRIQGYEAQRRGDLSAAFSLYMKAVALDPSYPTPHNDAGVILEEQGRLTEAEASYQQAVMLDPNYLEAHANLAMLYERMGEKEKAIYHWLKRYQLGDPYDPWTSRAEERLVALGVLKSYPGLKGQIYTRQRVVGEAFQSHERSLEQFRAVTEEHGDWP